MSMAHIKQVIAESPYRNTAYIIHLMLAEHADSDGLSWPKQETLAQEARCDVKTVQRVIKRMVSDGYLKVLQKGNRNSYLLQWNGTSHPSQGDIPSQPRGHSIPELGQDVPSYKATTNEPPFEPPKNTRTSGAPEGSDMIGHIPDLEQEEPKPLPYPENLEGTVKYFRMHAKKAFADGETLRTRKVISDLHRVDGLTYAEIQALVRMFFSRHETDIRAKRNEYTAIAIFQQMKQRLINQKQHAPSKSDGSLYERTSRLSREYGEKWDREYA